MKCSGSKGLKDLIGVSSILRVKKIFLRNRDGGRYLVGYGRGGRIWVGW